MKKIFALIVMGSFFLAFQGIAQEEKAKRPSPPATAENTVKGMQVKIEYSQPSVKGRKIWGELVPYGKVWRTGANEATTLEISQDATVNGKALPKGKYALFTIPDKASWTVIFNKQTEQWGAYKYDQSQDALRITVKPQQSPSTEKLTFDVDVNGVVRMRWENLAISFNVSNAN